MYIDKNRKVQLIRTIYKTKEIEDTSKSGGFKGELNQKDFNILISLMREIDWEKVQFPNIKCCDLPVRTILLSSNGNYRQFKSMKPPDVTKKLISFLTNLAWTIELPSYKKPMDFEDVAD